MNASCPGGVDEGDRALVPLEVHPYLIGTDVLGDPASLGRDDVRLADSVQQPGLPVIDVTHDRNDRRAGDQDRWRHENLANVS